MYLPQNYQQLRKWMQTDLGKYVLQQEAKELQNILNNIFAKNIILLGEPGFSLSNDYFLIDRNKYINQFIIHPDLNLNDQTTNNILLVARQDKLPIDSDSVDVVILMHSLEMISNPHEVLRESHRVLRAEGKIIITGFNAFSFWSVWKLVAKIFSKAPWRNKFISIIKLFDWLSLLGFDELNAVKYCYNLPINNKKFLNKLIYLETLGNFLPFSIGNIYTISACKRVIPLTPIFIKKWDKLPLDDDELVKPILKN